MDARRLASVLGRDLDVAYVVDRAERNRHEWPISPDILSNWCCTMKSPHRRQFLHLVAGAAALQAKPRTARSQTYPARPVRIIVGFAAGGGQDIVARLIGQWLSQRLGRTFLVDNRLGANGNIATEAVVKAPSDGYTLLHFSSTAAINATLYANLNFDFLRDIAPVASIIRTAQLMEVHPSVPATTIPEFIAYAQANPDKLNMASAGTGNSSHVAGQLFKVMAGINMQHIPYRGTAPAMQDLLTNRSSSARRAKYWAVTSSASARWTSRKWRR